MPAKKKASKSKSKRRSTSDMVVPGYTRSSGAYGRYQPVGPELKYFDTNTPQLGVAFGLATAAQSLNLVSLGTLPNQRIGRTINVRHIEVKINLLARWSIPANTVPELRAISYRVDLILDKQCNGALPAGADIYDTSIVPVAATCRFPNLLNSDRFTWMKRWEGDMNPPSAMDPSTLAGQEVIIARDLKLSKKCNVRVELNPNLGTTTIADVRSNNLFLVYSCDSGTAPANNTLIVSTADTRIRFQDS